MWKSAGHASSFRVLPWHLSYNCVCLHVLCIVLAVISMVTGTTPRFRTKHHVSECTFALRIKAFFTHSACINPRVSFNRGHTILTSRELT